MRLILIAGFVALMAVPALADDIPCSESALRVPHVGAVSAALADGGAETCSKSSGGFRSAGSSGIATGSDLQAIVSGSPLADFTLLVSTATLGSYVRSKTIEGLLSDDDWYEGAVLVVPPSRRGSYEIAQVTFPENWICLVAEGGFGATGSGYRRVNHLDYCEAGTEPLSDSIVESVIRAADEAFAKVL
jgi:hypothetical protein